ncbi:MAG: ABC transporter substrate-binding protein [Fibrobacteria bacterium]|nr:ABC transporter substrate-binding protein [Fibrobacteria bacterium]
MRHIAIATTLLATLATTSLFTGCDKKESSSQMAPATLEKEQLKLGFIKLTDCAPLVIARELGYFEEEGLNVTLEAQANWKVLLDRVIDGQLDGAHMLSGQPLGAAVGIGTQADIVVPLSLDLNGNGITLSNKVWDAIKPSIKSEGGRPVHPIAAEPLKPYIAKLKKSGESLKLGMVFPVSTHNYQLRYWLAASGINPGQYTATDVNGNTGADVLLSVTPPPQMPSTMEAGTIHGYCVGEPWNQAAVTKKIGVPVIASRDIWTGHAEKVLGLRADFTEKNPNTTLAIVKAVIKAQKWLDDPANRPQAVSILARSEYVGADSAVIANSMTGTFEFEVGDVRPVADFNVFWNDNASFPFYSDAIWYLTQMRRWGQIGEAKTDSFYLAVASKVYRPEIWKKAAAELVADGFLTGKDIPETDGFRPVTSAFIDSIPFDGHHPVAYLKSLPVGNKD